MDDDSRIKDETADSFPITNSIILDSVKEEIINDQSYSTEDVNIINNSKNITPEIKVENDCRNISEQNSTFITENSSPNKDEDNIFPITTPSLLVFIKEESNMNQNNYEVNELFHNEDKSNTIKVENYNIEAENNLVVKKEKYCRNMDIPNFVTIKESLVKGETDGSTDDFQTHTGVLPVNKKNKGKFICSCKRLRIINMHIANMERNPYTSVTQIRKMISNSMGISVSTIYKIIKEYKEKKLVTSPKRTRVRKSFRETFDDLARNTIRSHVQGICFRNEISTLTKIHQLVSNDESLPPISRTNLFHLLKELDFCKMGNKWVCKS